MKRRVVLAALPALAAAPAARAYGYTLNIVFDGDSVMRGIGSTEGHGMDDQVGILLSVPTRLTNVSGAGRPVLNCLQYYKQRVAPLLDPTSRYNLIIFQAGAADLTQGRDPRHTYAAFNDYVAAAHNHGWRVVVATLLQRFDLTSKLQAQIESYNTLLRANRAAADAVVDFDKDSRLTTPEGRRNRELFNEDGINPNDAGYAVLAAMLVGGIRRISSTA